MDTGRCEVCGGPCRVGQRTCSRQCSGKLGNLLQRGGQIVRSCEQCGETFTTEAAELRRTRGRCGRFCSRVCSAAWHRAQRGRDADR